MKNHVANSLWGLALTTHTGLSSSEFWPPPPRLPLPFDFAFFLRTPTDPRFSDSSPPIVFFRFEAEDAAPPFPRGSAGAAKGQGSVLIRRCVLLVSTSRDGLLFALLSSSISSCQRVERSYSDQG